MQVNLGNFRYQKFRLRKNQTQKYLDIEIFQENLDLEILDIEIQTQKKLDLEIFRLRNILDIEIFRLRNIQTQKY